MTIVRSIDNFSVVNTITAIRFWARWRPRADALVFLDERVTWARLDERTDAIAAGLQALDLEAGDRIGIMARNCTEWCLTVIGAQKAGLVVVPLNDRLAPREMAEIVEHAGCRAVVTDDDLAPKVRTLHQRMPHCRVVLINGTTQDDEVEFAQLEQGGTPQPVDLAPDDVAILTYTSGTTGLPKGVMLTHGNLLQQAGDRALINNWTPETLRSLLCVPLAPTVGIISNLSLTLINGGCLYLEPSYDPARALRLIVDERISSMIGVPVMYEGLTHQDGFADADLSSLTYAVTGGAPVPITLLQTFQRKGIYIKQCYGLTEATGFVADMPPHLALERPDCCGIAGIHNQIKIVDDDGAELPAGEVGEMLVRGPVVMKGYWRDPDKTAETIVDGWLHTGDLGWVDKDGFVYIVDRKKDMYISGGLNVYPAEVERVIGALPGVLELAVVAVPHPRWNEVGAAIIRAADGVTTEDIIGPCKENLAGYKVPKYVVFVTEELPRNLSGKILRRELRQTYQSLPETTTPHP